MRKALVYATRVIGEMFEVLLFSRGELNQ